MKQVRMLIENSSTCWGASSEGKMQEHPIEEFDVGKATDALEVAAESAAHFANGDGQLDPASSLVTSTVQWLKDVKTWLELRRTPFEDFAGEPVLEAATRSDAIAADFFVETVRAAVIELVQVAALVALRGSRRVPPTPRRGEGA